MLLSGDSGLQGGLTMKRTNILPVLVLIPVIATVALAAQPGGPSGGPEEAAMGFKNYGQYVAAKHVSDNLNISADSLRMEMVDNHLSLGDAIKKLRPELGSQAMRAEIKKAEAAARKA